MITSKKIKIKTNVLYGKTTINKAKNQNLNSEKYVKLKSQLMNKYLLH